MIRKLVVSFLLVVISQATFAVYAAMHFPGTATVDHTTFNGTATIEGYGSTTAYDTVNLHLFTASGSALTILCSNQGGNIAPGQISLAPDISQTSPNLVPDKNGNASFAFSIPLLSNPANICPNSNWSVLGLQGTLFATYTGDQFNSSGTMLAQATLGFQCNLDASVNPVTTCFKIFETSKTF